MTEADGIERGPTATPADFVKALEKKDLARLQVPKIDIFHFKGDRVSEWLELLEQVTTEVPEKNKFKFLPRYIWWETRPEVMKVAAEAGGDWAKFKAEIHRRFKLGDGLLTKIDLEMLQRDEFSMVGAFATTFEKMAKKVPGLAEEEQCATFLGHFKNWEASSLTKKAAPRKKLTWAAIKEGVIEGELEQVDIFQMQQARKKRKALDASTSEGINFKRMVEDADAQLDAEKKAKRKTMAAPQTQGKTKKAVVQEEEEEEEEELEPQKDLQRLNAVTVRDGGGLPNADVLSEACAGRSIISPIDLYSGYDQFSVYPSDKPMTAMHTPRGLIHMNVAPQGWTNAVAMVQRHMVRAMQPVSPHITQPYIDDLAVKRPKEKDEQEVMPGIRRFVWDHVQDLCKVLDLLKEHNFTASGTKSRHCMREATILGFVCNEKGRRPDTKKTNKILELPTPFETITEVRSFLGTCGFWRVFIKGFAAKTEQLRKLVRQGQDWEWGDKQESVIEGLKKEFEEEGLVLGLPDHAAVMTIPFIVETDAGPTALGGVLIQRDLNGEERPLRFEIRMLNTTERNYSQFRLRVNPTALAGSLKNFAPSDPTIVRWLTYIWMFDFELERIPGNKNRADGLSRVDWDKRNKGVIEDTPPVDGFLDKEEDVKLHINSWSLVIGNYVTPGRPIWLASPGHVRRSDIVLKPYIEEDSWGMPGVKWMMELALADKYQLREDFVTLETGPQQVEKHKRLTGGMYLLANSMLQEEVARIEGERQDRGENVIHEGEDDDFEEDLLSLKGLMKEGFAVAKTSDEKMEKRLTRVARASHEQRMDWRKEIGDLKKELERQDKEMEAMKIEVEKAWAGNEAIRQPAEEAFKSQKVEERANEQRGEEIPLLDEKMLEPQETLARKDVEAGEFEWRMPTILAHEQGLVRLGVRPPTEANMDEVAPPTIQRETVGQQEAQESMGQARVEAEVGENLEVSQKTAPPQDMPLVVGLEEALGSWATGSGAGERVSEEVAQTEERAACPTPSETPQQEVTSEVTAVSSSVLSQEEEKTTQKKPGKCFYCKKGKHFSDDSPKFYEDEARGFVTRVSTGIWRDRNGNLVERSCDGGRMQLYRQIGEVMID
ncbi:hypothetical protein CBR_g8490 [Chara braunii]|uniref:Reverse transcriptase domain-containing protein n=1 Tax=Chara braunii TaxID=69332 RepID=A0A388KMC3_CHABU|nr:hypothetical protein CBR_g8490 [Chara braunii]|eukprot:GBG71187.1 hypothetical protein CBR_g8490 [Chara braunii]